MVVATAERKATLEGDLVAKWRRGLSLSQEALGAACPIEISDKGISNIERGPSRTAIDTLLNIIRGLEKAGAITLGRDDAERLSTFFAGPDADDARRRFVDAAREIVARARPRRR